VFYPQLVLAENSSGRHRRAQAAPRRWSSPLSKKQGIALAAALALIAAACWVWADRWDATESTATCAVTEVQRTSLAPDRRSGRWLVGTQECGRLTVGYVWGSSGIAPSAVQPGSRYDFTLRGWEILLYHRQIVEAERVG